VEHRLPHPIHERRERDRRVLITGAGGQLGAALAEAFPGADARTHGELDVTQPILLEHRPDVVLHAAAWTDVDGAEADRQAATAVNVVGTMNVAALGVPVLYYSSDYVFDGEKRTPYVERDHPNPLSAYAHTKHLGEQEILEGWIVRSSWLFGWTGHNFVRTMLRLGAEREEVCVVDDQRGCPTYAGHLADASQAILGLPFGVYHVAADGDCTWAEFAEAIFELADLDCRVVAVSSGELGRPAPRPAYSVLRSEKPATPRLPHWREGLRACLERLAQPNARPDRSDPY
jgi:dTDP-4-dehydrorhamnose reductase